ncbi:MAG TPA: hypothetical protein PLP33_24530 [Leptospiraceae bacterium]|nr:hypothetical protein [Leptospiraceae bacterium]
MKVLFQYCGNSPANGMLTVFEGSVVVCKIDDSVLCEVLSKNQYQAWLGGKAEFEVSKQKLNEHCSKWFSIGR